MIAWAEQMQVSFLESGRASLVGQKDYSMKASNCKLTRLEASSTGLLLKTIGLKVIQYKKRVLHAYTKVNADCLSRFRPLRLVRQIITV